MTSAAQAVYHVALSPGGDSSTPWVYDGGSIQFGPGATTLTPVSVRGRGV